MLSYVKVVYATLENRGAGFTSSRFALLTFTAAPLFRSMHHLLRSYYK